MIQRIQSIYLACAVLIGGVLLFIPLGEIGEANFKASFIQLPEGEVHQIYALPIVMGLATVLSLGAIGSYKNRKIQMKITLLSMVMHLTFLAVAGYYFKTFADQLSAEISLNMVAVFPIIAVIFLFMAYRAIKKDDDLVKSVDRLR